MFSKRSIIAYGLLSVAWAAICVWQAFEHSRAQQSARAALLNRAGDISNSLGIVIRSQRRVSQPRLEAALQELTKSSELLSVALLNSLGEIVASSGETIDLETGDLTEKWDHWGSTTVTVANLIDLGPPSEEGEPSRPAVIVRSDDESQPWFRRGGRGRGFWRGGRGSRGPRPGGPPPPGPPPPEGERPPPPGGPDEPREQFRGPPPRVAEARAVRGAQAVPAAVVRSAHPRG